MVVGEAFGVSRSQWGGSGGGVASLWPLVGHVPVASCTECHTLLRDVGVCPGCRGSAEGHVHAR